MKPHSLILSFFSFISIAQATSFYIRPFSEFTQSAPNIARGVIQNVHAENGVTSDGERTIYTFAGFELKEVIKGDIKGSLITIRKPGGTKDGYTLEIPSSAEFNEGEEVVLFLSEMKEDQSYEVVGLELGKFDLESRSDEVVLKGGIFNYSRPPSPGEHQEHQHANDLSENQREWTLSDLKNLVREQNEKSAQTSTSETHRQNIGNSPQAPENQKTDSAPETQTESPPGENQGISPVLLFLSIGVLFVLGIFFYLRRR